MIIFLKPGEQVEVQFVLAGDPTDPAHDPNSVVIAEQFCLVRHDVGGTKPTDRRMRIGDKNQGWAAMRHGHGGSGMAASKMTLSPKDRMFSR